LVVGTGIAVCSYRQQTPVSKLTRLLGSVADGLLSAGALAGGLLFFSYLANRMDELPTSLYAATLLQTYCVIIGALVFSVLWSIRTLIYSLSLTLTGLSPARRLRLHCGAAGALVAAFLALLVQGVIGGFGRLGATELFYAIAVPGLIAFGWSTSSARQTSRIFAVASVWAASSVALAVFPFISSDGRVRVSCPGGPVGYHSVQRVSGAPWEWENNGAWLLAFAPTALVELSFLYIIDPQPEC
jgi:hypothetical protein